MYRTSSTLDDTAALEHVGKAVEEDLQVHAEGQVSGVFPVIFGLYIDGQLVAAVDLRQAGQAGTNVVGMCFIARIDQVVLVIQRGPMMLICPARML